MKTRIVFLGASNLDQSLARRIQADRTPDGVCFRDPATCGRLHIATHEPPAPGAKITATRPLTVEECASFCDAQKPGGGGLQQSLRLAEYDQRLGSEAEVCLVDTSPRHGCVATACACRNIQLVTVPRHNCPVNLVSAYGDDKLIVRSPVELDRLLLTQTYRRQIAAAVAKAAVVVCVSPKDADVASEFFHAAPGSRRYVQPTGSLPAELTLELARYSHGMASNAKEFGDLATELGIGCGIDETSPLAANEAITQLTDLRNRFDLPLQVGVITLGRNGCVVVDFQLHRGYAIEIINSDRRVATPSGAGDYWHAVWIYNREISRLGEPNSAVAATQTVAEAIGLEPGTFSVRVRELPIAGRRIASQRCPSVLAAEPAVAGSLDRASVRDESFAAGPGQPLPE